MKNKSDIVRVTCYGETETLTRSEAINKYMEGMLCCDGSERERYTNVYVKLIAGESDVDDSL